MGGTLGDYHIIQSLGGDKVSFMVEETGMYKPILAALKSPWGARANRIGILRIE